jgi:hypothetical protein
MPDNPKRTVTETVAELDGEKLLVVRQGGKIRTVQDADAVAVRIARIADVITALDTEIGRSDAEHIAAAEKRIDDHIEKLQNVRKGIATSGQIKKHKDRVKAKRETLAEQHAALIAAHAEMIGG